MTERQHVSMEFDTQIHAAESDPQQLEQLFQSARDSHQVAAFRTAMVTRYTAAPENVLLAAWYYRLQNLAEDIRKPSRAINWLAAVPLSILTGLIFWAISDVENFQVLGLVPQIALWWSPIATISALIFMAITAKKGYGIAAALGLGLLAAATYTILLAPAFRVDWASKQYLILAIIHIPLLCWVALGISVLGIHSSTADRFAFLIKSLEVAIVAGLYFGAGMAFGGITVGMFAALRIELPDIVLRLIAAGGFGLLPVLALATIYDPTAAPASQDFEQGLSKFIATMMRLLLPLTLVVLVIYILVIPFNFFAPFENRDLLIVYNLMLFAIVGLLMGATPIKGDDLSADLQKLLRSGIIVVAGLAVLVSVYALSAVVYRTVQGALTPNRLTVIGWNSINIGILLVLIVMQIRTGREGWIRALQAVFSRATNAYLAWGLFLLIAIPILF
jgi:multisubunit Na+/H+ antiporter MnhF subunit